MSLNKEQKKQIINDLEKDLRQNKFVILIDFKGLKAQDMYDLRNQLKSINCILKVTKKTLFRIAGKKENLAIDQNTADFLKNTQPAAIFSENDEISPSKTVYKFGLQNKNIKILGGFLKDKSSQYNFISQEDIISLAKLPSKKELLQSLVGSISSPINQFINVLQGNIKGLIVSLNNIKNNQTI